MAQEKNLDKALKRTIADCEREGIMVNFVRKHGSEAVNMLFTQWNLEDALEVRYEEGFEDGAEKGETIALIRQVCRKCQKGKTEVVIAEELEEPLENVEKICQAIKAAGTDDIKVIYEKLQELE